MQAHELWRPVPDIPEFLAGVVALQPGYNDLLVICDGQFKNGKCLVLHFSGAEAFHVYEEFAYPSDYEPELDPPPRSPGSRYSFPFFKITNSKWAAGSSQFVTFDRMPTHYRIYSLSYFADILSLHEPAVRWATPSDVDALFDSVMHLGEA